MSKHFGINRLKTRLRKEAEAVSSLEPKPVLKFRCSCGTLVELVGSRYDETQYASAHEAWEARIALHKMHCVKHQGLEAVE